MDRSYTRTILFSEPFDFPTPPTWGRQSVLGTGPRADSPSSSSSSDCASPVSEVDGTLLPTSLALEESRACSPSTLSGRPTPPPRPVRSPSTFCSPSTLNLLLLEKPLPMFPLEYFYYNVQQGGTGDHASGAVPDCPCCAAASMSRWSMSVTSDDSRPLSPSSAIHQRLRKMASASTLRSVRTSLRSRIKTGFLQLTRRGSV